MSIYEEHKAEYEFQISNPDQCYCWKLDPYDSCEICNPTLKKF
jgi:hypothetical protein